MRKVSFFTLVVAFTSLLFMPQTMAASPKTGNACSQAGMTEVANSKTFTCLKSGKKLIWSQGREISPKSIPPIAKNKVSLAELVKQAKGALANSDNQIPTLDTSGAVKIKKVERNILANFVAANTDKKFTFLGPTPLVETDSGRAGALSLVTKDQRAVYGSRSALPPWAVGFKLATTDSRGRFNLVSSGTGEPGQAYAWRLAYREGSGIWKYQSISGVSHPSSNQKYFDEVSLGAPGNYSIRLEFEAQTTFYGLGLADGAASVSPLLNSSAVRVLVLGDSWVWPAFEESGPIHVWDGYPGALSWLSGWNVISAGVRGQGYLSSAAGETYKDRIVRDVIPQNPAVVIFTGSSNDHLFSDQQIAGEMGRDIQILQKANPDVLIIVCSPYENGGDQKAPGQTMAMKAEAMRIGVPYIDFINLPLFDQSNNGQQQLSKGHPTRLGSSYIAGVLLKEIAAIK
ncbi:unannotated protein [freshwater metagenome]|uniref:Unannotated protein n=1 Tax=freshwater metagenome TaxID=449393 RepID=A0A6J7FYT3_9ZZZZ|nr:hypothetical protein [Actinomycetota bacterium]MSW67933.1 hypothetical protein [Actinomycetota bacterium]MSX28524.1 hypothetical protein [Actinomycetota bacterium]MTA37337.1 hypothetical protein [Actinomycetota bacterium]MTA48034.1 hypothetical protein [Actinomycetota bacterium]